MGPTSFLAPFRPRRGPNLHHMYFAHNSIDFKPRIWLMFGLQRKLRRHLSNSLRLTFAAPLVVAPIFLSATRSVRHPCNSMIHGSLPLERSASNSGLGG